MRILLTLDGSPSAERAQALLGTLELPAGSTIRIVSALERLPALFGGPWIPVMPLDADRYEEEARQEFEGLLAEAADRLRRPGVDVESALLRGSPATCLVDEMLAWQADLVVVGSRGHGPVASALLGSVSSAIVDHARTAVLVVRGERIGRVIFGEDGSAAAAAGAQLLLDWPMFAKIPIDVVSVVDIAAPWRTGMAPGMFAAAIDVYTNMIESSRATYEQLAEATAARLRQAGRQATASVRDGDPATQLCALATDPSGDVVLVGSRGHTGLSRVVLGSVAHSVVLHAPGSVLVVRYHAPASPKEVPAGANQPGRVSDRGPQPR